MKKDRKIFENSILNEISLLLFPPLQEHQGKEEEVYIVDCSADSNLEVAIGDIRENFVDNNTKASIQDVLERLRKIREILNIRQELQRTANFLIVDTMEKEIED